MRTSNSSGARFKSSHDVSPEEKKRMDNLDTNWATLPDFDEMAGKSAVSENAAGSRSPKRSKKDDEEYTMVGDFSGLERATSFVRDSNTATKSSLSGLADSGANDQITAAKGTMLGKVTAPMRRRNPLYSTLSTIEERKILNLYYLFLHIMNDFE